MQKLTKTATPDPKTPLPATLLQWTGEARKVDWSQRRLRAALFLLPAVGLSVGAGAAFGDPIDGVMAAGGAVAVGFGAFQRIGRSRTLPLGVALLAMAVSTFTGAVAHRNGGATVDVLLCTIWGWAFGLASTLGWGAWWVGLQGIVALCAFGSIPSDAPTALRHAGMLIAGGLVQLAVVRVMWVFIALPDPPEPIPRSWQRALWKNASWQTAGGRHAWRVALALGGGSAIEHALGLTHGYWVPMTAAILLKPDFRETASRGLARLGGTLVGAGLATLVAAVFRPGPLALNLGLLLAIYGCFSLQRVNYALYAVCITTYVVFALAVDGLPEPTTALARVEATLLGAAVAVAAHGIPLGRKA